MAKKIIKETGESAFAKSSKLMTTPVPTRRSFWRATTPKAKKKKIQILKSNKKTDDDDEDDDEEKNDDPFAINSSSNSNSSASKSVCRQLAQTSNEWYESNSPKPSDEFDQSLSFTASQLIGFPIYDATEKNKVVAILKARTCKYTKNIFSSAVLYLKSLVNSSERMLQVLTKNSSLWIQTHAVPSLLPSVAFQSSG